MIATKRLSNKSVAILNFIWRWKLTTTAQIAASFCDGESIQAAYNTLWRLKAGGFVQKQHDKSGRVLVWTLTRKGFEVVRAKLPELQSDGFLSETPTHDLLVQAIHLGPWGRRKPEGTELFTEQELRCIDKRQYPQWVPRSELRRPDGYWRIVGENGARVIALELELSRKDKSEYVRVRKFYDLYPIVAQVIWVVAQAAQVKKIVDKLTDNQPSSSKHNFILLDQIADCGWSAPVLVGPDQGKAAHSLLSNKCQNTVKNISVFPSVDTRRFPTKPRTSQECFSALLGD
jgi:hypothetical protein